MRQQKVMFIGMLFGLFNMADLFSGAPHHRAVSIVSRIERSPG
jgi:hypothetical protein